MNKIKALTILFLSGFLALGESFSQTNREQGYQEDEIRIYPNNPFYWQYKGNPTLLIGGSDDDNLFQMDKLREHLELLASVGGNYIRCTMSSRDKGNVKPYLLTEKGFDLEHPNPKYWEKFENLLNISHQRGIIVQIEFWATYDFYKDTWNENVFNPKNNVNYNSAKSLLPENVNHSAQLKINPFFETVPEIQNNQLVLNYQQKFIDKILSYTFQYDHVLYCIDNETNADPKWSSSWANYIRSKAKEHNKKIFITEMWDNWDPTDNKVPGVRQQEHESHPFLTRSKVSNTINAPEIYDFIEVSNNNAQNGEIHYLSAKFVRDEIEISKIIRPINNVKIYGGTIYEVYTKDWAGSYKDGEERFWRNVFAGHSSVRFHRTPYGHGLSYLAQNHIKSMRMLVDSTDFFKLVPSNELLSKREANEAFCLSNPGEEYVIYFPAQGEIDLQIVPNKYQMRWLHIRSSLWRNPEEYEVKSSSLKIKTPDNDQWVVILKRTDIEIKQ